MKNNIYNRNLIFFFLFFLVQLVGINDTKNPIDRGNDLRVLSRTEMASVITEASYICVDAEADSFYYNYDNHREWEAQANETRRIA